MIPKTIHYCWFSNDPFPRKIRRCMASWQRVHPDYKIRRWRMSDFDLQAMPAYVREAFSAGKRTFASDYIRLYALYTEGGIYLDSDVLLTKGFDGLLDHEFFSFMEYHELQIERSGTLQNLDAAGHRTADTYISGIQIQAAVMGAEAGSPFVREIMDWYDEHHFILPDGSLLFDVLSPYIYARVAERHGFVYKDVRQQLGDRVCVYPSSMFAGNKHEVTSESLGIHMCAHSWHLSPWQKLCRCLGIGHRYHKGL